MNEYSAESVNIITEEQIRMMAHALGWSLTAKSWMMEPYRNGYSVHRDSPSNDAWAELSRIGFAEFSHVVDTTYYWYVTKEGQEWLLGWLSKTSRSHRRVVAMEG